MSFATRNSTDKGGCTRGVRPRQSEIRGSWPGQIPRSKLAAGSRLRCGARCSFLLVASCPRLHSDLPTAPQHHAAEGSGVARKRLRSAGDLPRRRPVKAARGMYRRSAGRGQRQRRRCSLCALPTCSSNAGTEQLRFLLLATWRPDQRQAPLSSHLRTFCKICETLCSSAGTPHSPLSDSTHNSVCSMLGTRQRPSPSLDHACSRSTPASCLRGRVCCMLATLRCSSIVALGAGA